MKLRSSSAVTMGLLAIAFHPAKENAPDNWRPYCLMCKAMMRMSKVPEGFHCTVCKNTIADNRGK